MNKTFGKFAAAVVIYICFAVYLHLPHFKNFGLQQYLFVANAPLAGLGCYVLSRRWVSSFWGSLFAGAIYGFGPFMLSLAKFHPTAGLLAASIPWLFCPAAFGPKAKWKWLRIPLSVLPALMIILFFQVSSHYRLFAVPLQTRLRLADLLGLVAPLAAAQQGITLVGFYHIPIAALVMGFSMLFAARRFSVLIIFCLGIILASCQSLFGVSPIVWLSFPVLCCSVIIGAGLQGLCSTGFADKKWILASAAFMAGLSIVTLLLATKCFPSPTLHSYGNGAMFAGLGDKYAKLFLADAKMYVVGTIALAFIFFMVCAKLRIATIRLIILCSALAVDIFLAARFIVDRIL
jgi:hypothetical protein